MRSFMAHHQGMAFLVARVPAARPADAAAVRGRPGVPGDRPAAAGARARSAARSTRIRRRSRPRAARRPRPRRNCRVFTTPNTPAPEVHLLSNGRYHVVVTNAGGGYSRWRDLAVTRWHEDPTRDCWGTFCYLRDVDDRRVLVGRAPADAQARRPATRRSSRRAAPSSAAATTTSTRTSRSASRPRTTSSCGGSASPTAAATRAHDRADQLSPRSCSRRRRPTRRTRRSATCSCRRELVRDAAGDPLHAPAALRRGAAAVDDAPDDRARHRRSATTSYETGRAEFIGRGRSVADPAAMHRAALDRQRGLGARSGRRDPQHAS